MAFLFYKFTGTVTFQWVRIVIAAFGDQQTIKRSQCSEKELQTSSSPPGRFDSSSFEPTSVFADRNDTFHFLGEKKRKHRPNVVYATKKLPVLSQDNWVSFRPRSIRDDFSQICAGSFRRMDLIGRAGIQRELAMW